MRHLPLCLLLCACAQFPELATPEARLAQNAPYPTLVPLEQLLHGSAPVATEATASDLQARLARLRARANRLRGPVLDGKSRSRLASPIPTGF